MKDINLDSIFDSHMFVVVFRQIYQDFFRLCEMEKDFIREITTFVDTYGDNSSHFPRVDMRTLQSYKEFGTLPINTR